MQTADQNRMDMCRPRLALILGHTLKIESENSGNGMALRNVIPAPECRITCKEGKVAVFVHSLSVCACIHLCVCVCVCVCGPVEIWQSQKPIPGEHCVRLQCLMFHTVNSH